eukprot:SRR837773.23388.p1 GENE.SRR837773.23388~~SRR837773.23388.p1  ORF type:complete len:606 (-),score=133.05 SRR837773.23388:163-1734(-)
MVVLGAGLVGSLAAAVLARKGFKVRVYERYSDIRSIPSLGKSINLSVTSRGLRAIRALGGGIYEDVLQKLCTRVSGRLIHMPNGEVVFQRYGKDDTECNYSVSRFELNKYLIDLAQKSGAEFHFDHVLSDTSDFASGGTVGCVLHFKRPPQQAAKMQKVDCGRQAGATERVRLKVMCPVVACDGAGSRVRYALRRQGLTTFTEDLISRGYKEVLFPNPGDNDFGAKGDNGGEACPGRFGLHIWPRGDHMLMALSNIDGSFTGTIYMDHKGSDESFEAFSNTEEGRRKCVAFCEKHYAKAVPLVGGMDAMVRQITTNPTGILGTVKTSKWAQQAKVLLIGDACHAMCPFFGQGCNCGFEDTLWLSRLVDKYCCKDGRLVADLCTGDNIAAVFADLEKERKPNAEAICDMALENFVEMRDKTGDVRFQAMKKVENKLENTYPEKFRSRYAMVCYGGEGNVSYSNARRLGVIQDEILQALISPFQHEDALKLAADKVDLEHASRLIDEKLVPLQRELGIDLSTVKH